MLDYNFKIGKQFLFFIVYFQINFAWTEKDYLIILSKKEYVVFLNDNFNFKSFCSLNLKLLFNVNTLTLDTSISVVVGRIYRYQFKRIYLKNQKRFALLLLHYWNLH